MMWLKASPRNRTWMAASVTAFMLLVSCLPLFASLERKFLDLAFKLRGPQPAFEDVVIIAVTDQSLQKIGTWPWPRKYHATLLNILNRARPSAVFFDLIFAERSDAENDRRLAEAIQQSGRVILSYYFSAETARAMAGKPPEALPIPLFQKACYGMGFTNIFPDADGHLREIQLTQAVQGKIYEHASLAAAKAYLSDRKTPVPQNWNRSSLIINFPGPFHQFRVIPYEHLIAASQFDWAQSLIASLKGKIILVGHTATGTAMDLKPTAFSTAYPGVGVLASTVHTLLTGSWIHPSPFWINALFLFPFAWLIIALTEKYPPLKGLRILAGCLILLMEIHQLLFNYLRIWFPVGLFLVTALLIYVIWTLLAFIQVSMEREMMNRELLLGAKIQSSLLPTQTPQIPGLDLAAYTLPARRVGGDLYDFISLADGKCGIGIGDVSGKGVPAALFMARTVSEFRREAIASDPLTVIGNLNRRLAEGGYSGLFVTMLYLVIDPIHQTVLYVNGGHEPVFHYRQSAKEVVLQKTESGTPLGIDADGVFDQKEFRVEPGDILILESDGVKEAMNAKRELFGFERIEAALKESAHQGAQEIILHLKKRLDEFVKDAPQHDDMTMVCIKFSPAGSNSL